MTTADRRVILVTGGTGGIGQAIAAAAAAAGWHVVVHTSGRSPAPAGDNDVVTADFRDISTIAPMFRDFESRFGRLDALVNNAGIEPAGDDPLDAAAWSETLTVNLLAAVECARAALPLMTNGVIVNISSLAGAKSMAYVSGSLAYAASKAAMDKLTEQLALMVAPAHRVVGIAPGHVLTDMWTDISDPARRAEISAEMPLGRLILPDDIAAAVMFALDNPAMTGSIIDVHAGLGLRPL